MLNEIATVDALTWVSICVKALVYAASLAAAGSVLCIIFLRALPVSEIVVLKRFAVWLALAAGVLSLIRIPLRAGFLMGGTWQGATDPMILSMVVQSPLGTSIAVRLVGFALIFAVLIPARWGRIIACFGALMIAASFVLRGHTVEEPRLLLGALISLHLLGLSFWLGVFVPLYRMAGTSHAEGAGRLAEEFGHKAVFVVASLTIAGGTTLWIMTGDPVAAVYTLYGQLFILKLSLFLGVISLATWNKIRLTPALLRYDPTAGAGLRRSIRWEVGFVMLVLLATAILTTISAPGEF
jgi:putative copper resistance protein D